MTADEHTPKGRMLWVTELLILLYVVSLPIVRPLNFRVQGLQVPWSDLIFLAAFAAWAAALLIGQTRFRRGKFYYFAGAYALAMTLSAIFTDAPFRSLVKLAAVYYLIAVGLIVFNLVRDVSFLKKLVFAWLAGAALTIIGSLAGVVGFYTYPDVASFFLSHYGSLPPGNYPRSKAFFENANMMCNYLNVCFVLALAAGSVGWIRRGVALALAALIFASAFFTLSAGIGGLVLSAGLWFGFRDRTSSLLRTPIFIAAAMISFLAFASTLISPDTQNTDLQVKVTGLEREVEVGVRPLIWWNALVRGMEHPILGRGTGTDAVDVFYVAISGQQQFLRDAHNAWLNIFGQAGIIGLVAFTALCWYLWSTCRFESAKPIHLALSAAFVGAFLFQNLFGSFEDARHLWVLVGMLAAIAVPDGLEPMGETGT